MRPLLLLLAAGCYTEQVCTQTAEPVGDDDPTDLGMTAAEAFALAGGLYATTGRTADGTETPVEIDVTRRGGTAEFLRATWEQRRVPGIKYRFDQAFQTCPDALQVPVQLAVRTPDELVSLDEPALLVHTDWMVTGADQREARLSIEVAPDELEGVPLPDDLDPDYGFAIAQFAEGEEQSGAIGYGGTSEDENGPFGWAHYVLTW